MVEQELETVIVRIANLELTITARALPEHRASVSVAPAASSRGSAATFFDPFSISEQLEDQAISAATTRELSALPLHFLSGHTSRLRGSDQHWTPTARAGRAFRAGVVARRQLDGIVQEGQSLGTPFRNSIYVVLRDRDSSSAFWTPNYPVYARAVLETNNRNNFARGTISHAFASRAEAEIYCVGARVQWPQERQD